MGLRCRQKFYEEISAEITPEEYVYKHKWQPKQIAIWDNRCLLHRATHYDTEIEKRVMRRYYKWRSTIWMSTARTLAVRCGEYNDKGLHHSI